MNDLLDLANEFSQHYLDTVNDRRVTPSTREIAALARMDTPLPEDSSDAAETLRLLHHTGSPATVASAGGRYFGLVMGGALPVSVAAGWMAAAWDQNGIGSSPVAISMEEITLRWLLDILGLPSHCGGAIVTGTTLAHVTALTAACHEVLRRAGWDANTNGLFGAPPVNVVVGDEVHPSLLKALGIVGLGRGRVTRVPVDNQGRMRSDALSGILSTLSGPTIVCIQAGNVNTGAFDPAHAICPLAREHGAWVHVDGAFGAWAAASPDRAHLLRGYDQADSWATDGHKWLNVPYDSGFALVRNPDHLVAVMKLHAEYLPVPGEVREPMNHGPEMSRKARAIEVWAALRTLGRRGVGEMIERTCRHASRFAEGLSAAGYRILNEVVINQVLVSFGDADETRRVIAELQEDSTCWCGITEWQGQVAMRISVSSWATTGEDVERSLAAMLRIARHQHSGSS